MTRKRLNHIRWTIRGFKRRDKSFKLKVLHVYTNKNKNHALIQKLFDERIQIHPTKRGSTSAASKTPFKLNAGLIILCFSGNSDQYC